MTPTDKDILQTYDLIRCINPESVIEIRAFGNGMFYGYFNDRDAFLKEVKILGGPNVSGIYLTLNPVLPGLIARAENKMRRSERGTLTANDTQILWRRWALIDFDPTRIPDTSSTNEQHELSIERAAACRDWLSDRGIVTLFADSGNGAHLLMRIDMPNDNKHRDLIQAFLVALGKKFDDDIIEIDTVTHNASRISKLYGTWARKGDNTQTWPHRRSVILDLPDDLPAASDFDIQSVIDDLNPAAAPKKEKPQPKQKGNFDVRQWMADHSLTVVKEKEDRDGWHDFIIDQCPFDPDHNKDSPMIGIHSSGALSFHCFHKSCAANDWKALRCLLEPNYSPDYAESFNLRDHKGKHKTSNQETVSDFAYLKSIPPFLQETDIGNAMRLVATYGNDLRYSTHRKMWMSYDGRRWEPDESERIRRDAQKIPDLIFREREVIEGEKSKGGRMTWASKSGAKDRVSAMVSLAQSRAGVGVRSIEWDRNPNLLNTMNGTLDTETYQLLPHKSADLLTQLSPCDYDPNAECPSWDAFLQQVLPDDQVRDFVQRAVGYCLTGDISERCIFILHGSGRNGKSTFIDTIAEMMGDYSVRASTELLMVKQQGGGGADAAAHELARLKGARFAHASEADQGRRMSEALIKEMTGGEEIVARLIYGTPFSYYPEFKIWLGTNHRPNIRGTDEAIWDRIRLIPFTVRIPDEDVIPRRVLKDTLMSEMSGILAWAVRGLQNYIENGLPTPEAVKDATTGYRFEMDAIGLFLAECCESVPGMQVASQRLYNRYRQWCDDNKEHTVTQTAFSTNLSEQKGYIKKKTNTSKFWQDLTIVVEATPDDEKTYSYSEKE